MWKKNKEENSEKKKKKTGRKLWIKEGRNSEKKEEWNSYTGKEILTHHSHHIFLIIFEILEHPFLTGHLTVFVVEYLLKQ